MRPVLIACLAAIAALSGCQCGKSSEPAASLTPSAASSAPAAAPVKRRPADVLSGSTVARSLDGDALFIAEEDRKTLRVMPVPKAPPQPSPSASAPLVSTSASAPVASASAAPPPPPPPPDIGKTVALPGPPAQVVALDGRVLVTIRDPGLLLVLEPDETGTFKEKARAVLPYDAWGLSVTPNERTALVTSAWTHQVSAVDIASMKLRFTLDVAREPRGIAITEDGSRAYISHLVGSKLSRIQSLNGDKPELSQVSLPVAPLRSAVGNELSASLGYSLVLSPDGMRLYAARHALGALGQFSWFGSPSVDVLLTKDDTPLCPQRKNHRAVYIRQVGIGNDENPHELLSDLESWAQPRGMVYRRKNHSLLVVSEGNAVVKELDAYSIDPGAMSARTHHLYRTDPDKKDVRCAGASGMALSRDEMTAWVYCRVSGHLGVIRYKDEDSRPDVDLWDLEPGSGDKELEEGRRLFHTADDSDVSGGLGCAGCHPEGRDDGFVWLEAANEGGGKIFVADSFQGSPFLNVLYRLRQTPMLAGRVRSSGPYGWRAQNETLLDRVKEGFRMHRWFADWDIGKEAMDKKAKAIGYFVRNGLVAPPRKPVDALSKEEQRGREVFMSEQVGCNRCHSGEEYTDRAAVPVVAREPIPDFDEDERKVPFKTPSLFYVGSTPPYYHDGSAKTLEELIENNNDRMGKTNQLSKEDRAALVAFLRAL